MDNQIKLDIDIDKKMQDIINKAKGEENVF